jgi:hypothetical protein
VTAGVFRINGDGPVTGQLVQSNTYPGDPSLTARSSITDITTVVAQLFVEWEDYTTQPVSVVGRFDYGRAGGLRFDSFPNFGEVDKIVFNSISLQVTTLVAAFFPTTIVPQDLLLWLVRDQNPNSFATETGATIGPDDPWFMDRVLLRTLSLPVPNDLGDADYNRTFVLDQSAIDIVNSLILHNEWNGRLCFLLTCRAHSNAVGPGVIASAIVYGSFAELLVKKPQLITDYTEIPYSTGRSTPRARSARSRMDICFRCGQISLREDWVRDGLTGRMVCARCYDPPDPPPKPHAPPPRGANEDS